MDADSRIFFLGNPWPEGHPIKEFEWSVELRGDRIWCHVHLCSADYYSERDIELDEEPESDWAAPIVWGNYHRCILSSTYWGHAGFDLCGAEDFTPDVLDGLTLEIDPNPEDVEDFYDLAFGLYLLGHDACGKHRLTFSQIGQSPRFNIIWMGKIAKAYVGDYEYRYDFIANINNVALPEMV